MTTVDFRALLGQWFNEVFPGPMPNPQRLLAGDDTVLETRVEDADLTMARVEASNQISALRGTPIPAVP